MSLANQKLVLIMLTWCCTCCIFHINQQATSMKTLICVPTDTAHQLRERLRSRSNLFAFHSSFQSWNILEFSLKKRSDQYSVSMQSTSISTSTPYQYRTRLTLNGKQKVVGTPRAFVAGITVHAPPISQHGLKHRRWTFPTLNTPTIVVWWRWKPRSISSGIKWDRPIGTLPTWRIIHVIQVRISIAGSAEINVPEPCSSRDFDVVSINLARNFMPVPLLSSKESSVCIWTPPWNKAPKMLKLSPMLQLVGCW